MLKVLGFSLDFPGDVGRTVDDPRDAGIELRHGTWVCTQISANLMSIHRLQCFKGAGSPPWPLEIQTRNGATGPLTR